MRVMLNSGRALLPKQLQLVRSKASVRVIVGGYGSAKTTGAVLTAVVNALKHPWRPEYGDGHPTTLVIGKTDKVIRDSSMEVFRRVVPKELVLRERKSVGERSILLEGGHEFLFRTWGGAIEGITAQAALLDEAHLLDDASAFTNYLARLRDPLADRALMVVAGIPEFGWLRETFGPEAQFPDSEVISCSTYENTYLKTEDIDRIKASCSSRAARTYLLGEWAAPENAVFYEWDPQVHLTDMAGDPSQPCHLSMDVGNRGAVLWWQEREVRLKSGNRAAGLVVVDEWTPEQLSARAITRAAMQRPWKFRRDKSLVFVDPATDRDELQAITEEMDAVHGSACARIVRKERGDREYYREEGFRAVNAALMDANGDTRLRVWKGLPRTKRSLIPCIPKIRRRDSTNEAVKDNVSDHVAMDCFRYPVAHLLPLKTAGVVVRQSAA